MELQADCLQFGSKLVCLEGNDRGKFDVVYASAESATEKRFLQSLKMNTTFSNSLVACVVGNTHTVLNMNRHCTPTPRGVLGIQGTGMIEWSQKSRPEKIPRASSKTQKNPWIKT